jgi:hypothetical protein
MGMTPTRSFGVSGVAAQLNEAVILQAIPISFGIRRFMNGLFEVGAMKYRAQDPAFKNSAWRAT